MKNQKFVMKSALAMIRAELRRWYGIISVEELVCNCDLAQEIAVLERMLVSEGR